MKAYSLTLLLFLVFSSVPAQTLRFFEFTTECGHGNWQDTSFIAATADTSLINELLEDISKPFDSRKFIAGTIDNGNAGYNHNASHWFLWHFVPGEWGLAEMAIEVCDGCPYSDVDADTAYWISNIGNFCPWSGKPAREIESPLGINPPNTIQIMTIYPNPAENYIRIKTNSFLPSEVIIYNALGTIVKYIHEYNGEEIDLNNIDQGIYYMSYVNALSIISDSFIVWR